MQATAAQVNLDHLTAVATRLGALREQAVFLGGAVLPLLVPESLHPSLRFAKDVDLMVSTPTKAALWDFEDQLWDLGFKRHSVGATSQWTLGDIHVDVLMTDPGTVNFINPYGPALMQNAGQHTLGNGVRIRTISTADYLSVKLAAFRRRGRGDFEHSKDPYDILVLLRGSGDVERDLARHPSAELRAHVLSGLKGMLTGVQRAQVASRVADQRAERFRGLWNAEVVKRLEALTASVPAPAPEHAAPVPPTAPPQPPVRSARRTKGT